MKLIPCSLDEYVMAHGLASENRLLFMGIYRVMFGFRVRAGFFGDAATQLDWCGGGSWPDVERLYSIMYHILSRREESSAVFDDLPSVSSIKPFYNDPKFMLFVERSISEGDFELKTLDMLPVSESVQRFLKNFGNQDV